jgi:NADPH-dependent curcumin reductase CurA
MISIYNATEPQPGPRNLALLIGKNIRMEGFIVSHHFDLMPKFIEDLSGWVKSGKVTWKETVFEGIEKAPDAFIGLFKGENLGKMLVKLA